MPEAAAPFDDRRWLPRLILLIAVLTLYRGLTLWFGHLDLYVDEAQYWTWAKHLDWGYYSKPPVIALLIAFTTWVGDNGVFWVKCGALICYPISTLLLYALARRLFDPRIAFWSACAFLLLPGVSFSSMIISTDVPFFVFWCLGLYAYWCALEGDRWSWWLVAGIAGGLGLQTKYTMILFVVAVVLHLATDATLRRHFRNPKLYAAMALAALIFLPNLLWNALNGWPTLVHTEQISHLQSNPGLHWNHLGGFFGAQFAVMGPVFFGAWLWLTFVRPARWWKDQRLRFLTLFALVFLGIICLQALGGRANANWGAMAYASATVFIVALLLHGGKHSRWFAIGLAINVIMMPIAYHFDWWTDTAGMTLTAHNDPYKRVRGWAEFGVKARTLIAEHPHAIPLGDERDTVAELKYYVRPQAADTLEWNPDGKIHDQYTLTPTLAGKRGRDFLFITRKHALPAEIKTSFAQTRDLGPLTVQIHKDWALAYHAYLLRDFLGYRTPAVGTTPHG